MVVTFFILKYRLRIMANDRTYSDWSPFFQSEIPLWSRLLVEIPKVKHFFCCDNICYSNNAGFIMQKIFIYFFMTSWILLVAQRYPVEFA